MQLRVGIVGLGDQWDTRYRPALRALSDRFEVRAVCAEVPHLTQQVARDFKAQGVDGFRVLCQREDVDAVLVLSASWYGALPIHAACEAGKAIYSAPFVDVGLEQAEELKTQIDSAGISFVAEFPRRLYPATTRLKELIATRLGEPRLIFCHRRVPLEAEKSQRRKNPLEPTNVRDLLELVDWCQYVAGKDATSVFGVRHFCDNSESEVDYEMMNLDFSEPGKLGQGATAQISSGRYIPSNWPEAIAFRPPAPLQVACERGIAFIDLPSTVTWFDSAGRHMETLESERPVGEAMLLQFYRSVTSLVRRLTDLEDTFRSLRIVLAATQSTRESRRVFLESIPSRTQE